VLPTLDRSAHPGLSKQCYAPRLVRGDRLSKLCTAFRANQSGRDFVIVLNRVAMMDETTVHRASPAPKDLIERNILPSTSLTTPAVYEKMRTVRVRTEGRDLIKLRRVDAFIQSVSKNLRLPSRQRPIFIPCRPSLDPRCFLGHPTRASSNPAPSRALPTRAAPSIDPVRIIPVSSWDKVARFLG
jgi:hypothetical protein